MALTEGVLVKLRQDLRVQVLEMMLEIVTSNLAQSGTLKAEDFAAKVHQLRTIYSLAAVPGIPAEYSDLAMSELLDVFDSVTAQIPGVVPKGQ